MLQPQTPLVLFVMVAAAGALELPAYITKCPRKPTAALNECAVKQAPRVLKALAKGDRKYGVPPIDPFPVELMKVEQPGITMNFTKMQLIGMSDGIINNIILDESAKDLKIEYFMPKVSCVAYCTLDANLRVIHLKGEGNSRIDMFNVTGFWKGKWTEKKYSDGQEHLEFLDAIVNIRPTKTEFQIDNLFNGDVRLENAVNNILNENWNDVIEEVKPSVQEALAEMQKVAMSGFTRNVPVANLFS